MPYASAGSRPRGLRRWSTAAVAAFSLHAGAAMAVVYWPVPAEEESAGTMTVELAPVVMTSAIDLPDVAHGPLMQDSVTVPTAVRQVAEKLDAETPQVDPSPAPEPEVVLPKPQKVEEPKPEETQQRQEVVHETAPAQAAPTTIATAPPSIDAPATGRAAAPIAGVSKVPATAWASWRRAVVSHLNRFKRYPNELQAQRLEGTVMLSFTLDGAGRVVAARVAQSSGSARLDEEAITALARASPLPAPPEDSGEAGLDQRVPFQFRLKR